MAKSTRKSSPTPFFNRLLPMSFLVGLSFFILYASMVSPTNVGYGISDELITIANNLGIARPPGYPLHIALLFLFTRLPLLDLSIASKAHLLSSLFASAAIAFTFTSSWLLYDLIIKNYKRKFFLISKSFERLILSFVSAITLGLTGLFWLYALVAEIYSLSALFVAILTFLFIKLLSEQSESRLALFWYSLCVTFGLAVSHHQFLVLLLPTLILSIWNHRSKLNQNQIILGLLSGFVAFVLPYSLLYVFNSQNPSISWNPELNFEGISNFISQGEWSSYVFKKQFYKNTVFVHPDINSGITSLSNYLQRLTTYTGIWIIVIGALAIYSGFKKNRSTFLSLFLLYLFIGLLLAAYLVWPSDWGSQAQVLAQFTPGLTLIPLLLLFGWLELTKRLGVALSILAKSKTVYAIITILILTPFLFQAYTTYSKVNFKSYTLVSQRYNHILNDLEPNALLTCYSDTSCAALLYAQSVDGIRQDVDIIPLAYPLVQATLDQPDMGNFNYPDNPFILFDIVSWNLDRRPVYTVDLDSFYNSFYGFNIPIYYYIPRGYYGQISKSLPDELESADYSLTQIWLNLPTSEYDPMRHYHKSQVAKDHIFNGSFFIKSDQRQEALREFNLASNIYHQYSQIDIEQFDALRKNQESGIPLDSFSLGSSSPSSQELIDYIPALLEAKRYQRAYQAALSAVSIDPSNLKARLTLARLYDQLGDLNFTRIEFANVLRVDPENQEAQERLSQLNLL